MTEEQQKEKQLGNDYRAVMNTPEGQRLLRHIVGHCGIYNQSFTGNSETFFREGKRNIGLKILKEVEVYVPDKMGDLLGMYANKK